MERTDEDNDLQLDNTEEGGASKLLPLPINGFPGECAATLMRGNDMSSKLVISQIVKLSGEGRKRYFSPSHTEFKFDFSAEYVDIAIVDSLPRELTLLTIKGIGFSLCDGIGINDEKTITSLHIDDIELDDMLAQTEHPVALMCRVGKSKKPFFSLELHKLKDPHLEDNLHLSYSHVHVGKSIEVEIDEKFVWAFMNFVESISMSKLGGEGGAQASVDPDMNISMLSVVGLSAYVSFETDPTSRPKGLNFASNFGLGLADIDNVKIKILKSWEIRNLKLKQSSFMRLLAARIRSDFSKQILPILFSGLTISIVSNVTTGAISTIADTAAALSLDDKFEKARSKKSGKNVEDIGDGLVAGGESLAKGLVSGISGIFTKPISGAKKEGAKGFAKGIAKGLIGVATKPLSGALDMVSKSVEGVTATIDGVKDLASTRKKRLRYPRAFTGDRILRSYNAFTAQGQHMFRTSMVSANLERLDLTKEVNVFTDDFYEHHEPLPQDRVFVITDQRVMSLKLTKGRLEESTIVWHQPLDNIVSVQLADPRTVTIILNVSRKKFTLQQERTERNVVCFPGQAQRLLDTIQKKRRANQILKEQLEQAVDLMYGGGSDEAEGPKASDEDGRADTRECSDFEVLWYSGSYKSPFQPVSVWRPKCPHGYTSVGDMVSFGKDPPPSPAILVKDAHTAKPTSFHLEWRDTKKDVAFWVPVPPKGYVAVGCIVQSGSTEPSKDAVSCVKESMVYQVSTYDSPCWYGLSFDRQQWPLMLWQVDNNLNTFIPRRSKVKDTNLLGYDLLM